MTDNEVISEKKKFRGLRSIKKKDKKNDSPVNHDTSEVIMLSEFLFCLVLT